MSVEIANKTRQKVEEKLIREVTEKFLRLYKIKKEVSIAIVGDTAIKSLNNKYRHKNKTTDILSFIDDDPEFLGEIIISYAQLKKQAPKFSRSFKEELTFILIHGLLHLIGYEDETEKGRVEMEKEGERLIKRMC